jgi:hypothetical protein
MKKAFAFLFAAVLLFPAGGAARAAEENLMRRASVSVSCDIPTEPGCYVGFINDGDYSFSGNGFVAKANITNTIPLPHEILIDFGKELVSPSSLTIRAFLAQYHYGITSFELQYWINGAFVSVYSSSVSWSSDSSVTADAKSFPLPANVQTMQTTKIRFLVTGKYNFLFGNRYRIDELEIYGECVGVEPWTVRTAYPPFVSESSWAAVSLPKEVDVVYNAGASGTETVTGKEAVIWNAESNYASGRHRIAGSLPNYPDKAVECLVEIYDPDAVYADVADSETAQKLALLNQGGYVYEFSDNFRPDASLTRMELARYLYNIKKLKPVYKLIAPDIFSDEFYYGVAAAVTGAGLMSVTANGLFAPNRAATEAELADALERVFGVRPESGSGACARRKAAHTLADMLYGDIEGMNARAFTDSKRALSNPDMGFMIYYYNNSTRSYDVQSPNNDLYEDVQGANVAHLRFPWTHIEPQKGVYNWSFIDTQIQRFRAAGKNVYLGITCSETGLKYATPEWVRQEGAQGVLWRSGSGPTTSEDSLWIPYFDDAVFLRNLETLLAAMARKYDGNPSVSGMDMRSLGVWGEGHTMESGVTVSTATIKKHIDLHTKYFKKTRLVLMEDLFRDDIVQYAAAAGFGMREDSVVGDYRNYTWWRPDDYVEAEPFWRNAPVVLETLHVFELKSEWSEGKTFLEAIENYHASLLSMHHYARAFYAGNRDFMRKANSRVGYRVMPDYAVWNRSAEAGGEFTVRAQWRNRGVAPFYNDGWPVVFLKNAEGETVAEWADESFRLKALGVGPEHAAPAQTRVMTNRLPENLATGTYSLYIRAERANGTGAVDMPPAGRGADGSYLLGEIEIAGAPSVKIITDTAVSGFFADKQRGDIQVELAQAEAAEADAYIALYGADGRLLYCAAAQAGEAGKTTLRFAGIETDAPAAAVKALLWKSGALEPIAAETAALSAP